MNNNRHWLGLLRVQIAHAEPVLWNDWPISTCVLAIPRSSPLPDYRRTDGVDPCNREWPLSGHCGSDAQPLKLSRLVQSKHN